MYVGVFETFSDRRVMADFVSKIAIFDKKRKIQLGSEKLMKILLCEM